MDIAQKCHCPKFLDSRLLWHETSAADDSRPDQCYPTGAGAARCNADFGEKLNYLQWTGVLLAVVSFFMLSRSGKKEGIDFEHNVWIYAVVGAAILGAVSGLYDKFLMNPNGLALDKMAVQSWYNIYQCGMMGVMMMLIWYPNRQKTTPFSWKWSIIFISIFLSVADFVYLYALSMPGAMISIVSMVRRGSVIVSFLFAALVFKEKNLRSKALDLALVLLGMVFLYLGSR